MHRSQYQFGSNASGDLEDAVYLLVAVNGPQKALLGLLVSLGYLYGRVVNGVTLVSSCAGGDLVGRGRPAELVPGRVPFRCELQLERGGLQVLLSLPVDWAQDVAEQKSSQLVDARQVLMSQAY